MAAAENVSVSNSPIQEHLQNALTSGNPNGLKEWIAAEMNRKNESGLTPLHISSKNGQKDIVECLIKFGANVNAKCETDENLGGLHLIGIQVKHHGNFCVY